MCGLPGESFVDSADLMLIRTQTLEVGGAAWSTRDRDVACRGGLYRVCVPLLLAARVLSAVPAGAQDVSSDSVRILGRVADAAGAAIAGATVAVTISGTTDTWTTLSAATGQYEVLIPNPGDSTVLLVAMASGYAVGRASARTTAGSSVIRADILLARTKATVLETVRVMAQRSSGPSRRNVTDADIGGIERSMMGTSGLPVPSGENGDLASLAASVIGVSRIANAAGGAGFSVMGADPSRNHVALAGMPFSSGAVPRDLALAAKLSTSSYDVSQGGFSGGRLDLSIVPGSNITTRHLRVLLTDPAVQSTDVLGARNGQQFREREVGIALSGPVAIDRIYYRGAAQFNRRTQPAQDLLSLDDPGLAALSLSRADRARFVEAAIVRGVPIERPFGERSTTSGSAMLQFDFRSRAAREHSVTAAASWDRTTPLLFARTAPGSYGLTGEGTHGSLQGRQSLSLGSVLVETSLGFTTRWREATPLLPLPEGRVVVGGPSTSTAELQFGSPGSVVPRTREAQWSLRNQTSWRGAARRHVLRATTEISHSAFRSLGSRNEMGTFTFQSLDSLINNLPSSYFRSGRAADVAVRAVSASVALGVESRLSRALALQAGVRGDATRFANRPPYNDALFTAFGTRADRIPSPLTASPRAGLTWDYGTQASGSPRGTVRLGIGRFVSSLSPTHVIPAYRFTGSADAEAQLWCAGASSPPADFDRTDGITVPTSCRDQPDSALVVTSPNVHVFASDLAPVASWRSTLAWEVLELGDIVPELQLQYSWDENLPSRLDRNLVGLPRFVLAEEASRPIYVQPTAIDQATGLVTISDSRIHRTFAHAFEHRADQRAHAWQFAASLIRRRLGGSFTRLAYAHLRVRQWSRGFDGATFSDPSTSRPAPGRHEVRHAIKVSSIIPIKGLGTLLLFLDAHAGRPYTPLVQSDINGDGLANDQAFVFHPSHLADTALARELRLLMQEGPRNVRRCLGAQLGQVAAPNSCRSPWTAGLDARMQFNAGALRLPQRLSVSVEVLNVLAGVDRVLHGARDIRGWGQPTVPDPYLLRVVGFDRDRRAFTYRVNERFGARQPAQQIVRVPFQLRVQLGLNLTENPVRQELHIDRKRAIRPSADTLLSRYLARFPDPFAAVLAMADSIRLSDIQVESLRDHGGRYVNAMRDIWGPAAGAVSASWHDVPRAAQSVRTARQLASERYDGATAVIRALLDADQIYRLPPGVQFLLDPDFTRLAGLRR